MIRYIFVAILCTGAILCAQDHIWLEGENPSAANAELNREGWGDTDVLSGGNWLSAKVEVKKGEKLPAEGIIMSYDFEIAAAGAYEIWNRTGFLNVRSPFDWRIDDGPWQTIGPDALATDLMPVAFWNEVSWLPMGKQKLTAGKHRIEIRLLKDRKGKILYVCDALCLSKGTFKPNGKYQPGDSSWRKDEDRQAAEQVFSLPNPVPGERVSLALDGLWQYARYDEYPQVENRTGPTPALPEEKDVFWSSLKAPGERNWQRPEQALCHRYVLRTRIRVPEDHAGRAFILRADELAMLSTLFVNGERVAFHDAPLTAAQWDVSGAIRPGAVNEIALVIKDHYYAINPKASGNKDIEHRFVTPPELFQGSGLQGLFRTFDFPMKGACRTGILDSLHLISTGPVYVDDAFVTTSVRKKRFNSEMTLINPGKTPQTIKVSSEVRAWKSGDIAKRLQPQTVTIPANGEKTVQIAADWANPRLWWRDDPFLYELHTSVEANGKIVDRQRTRFGFREWWIDGHRFVLNGVPQHLTADVTHQNFHRHQLLKGLTTEQVLKDWRDRGINHFRLRFQNYWGGMSKREFLDWCDENGIVVRRTVSTFDGQHASYRMTIGGRKDKRVFADLFENWRTQVAARCREERNHPSIFIWELDNEILYINGRTEREYVDPEFVKAHQLLQDLDPSRSVMSGGGNALIDHSLPVAGVHYFNVATRFYPDEAYNPVISASQKYEKANHPKIDLSKPVFIGEANQRSFAPDYLPMVYQGYRWWGLAGYTEWGRFPDSDYHGIDESAYRFFQPVVAFVREWNQALAAGHSAERTVRVFNHSRYDDPVTFTWRFVVGGKTIAEEMQELTIAPGDHHEATITLAAPAGGDAEAQLELICAHRGAETFRDVKPLHVLDTDAVAIPAVAAGAIAVIDPQGSAAARLKKRRIPFVNCDSLDAVPDSARLIVVGYEAVSEAEADSVRWLQLAASGKRLVVLEQEHPLHGQAVPADLDPGEYDGSMVEVAIPTHPLLSSLRPGDFHTWSQGHGVYRDVYRKPTRGARTLLHCAEDEQREPRQFDYTPLVEVPVNDGLMYLSQLRIGEKLAYEPVAQRLFDRMVEQALSYQMVRRATVAVLTDDKLKAAMLQGIGLDAIRLTDPVAALAHDPQAVVLVEATPAHLAALRAKSERVRAFVEGGGWLMLWGVTPEGLADFNALVGVDHLIRPFRMEAIGLADRPHELAAGISATYVDIRTAEKCQNRGSSATFLDDQVFSHIVDLKDIAPFCEFPGPGYWNDPEADTRTDRWPLNMVNGVTSDYHWRFIFSMHLWEGDPVRWSMQLPRRERITGFSLAPNATYHEITRLKLIFHGEETSEEIINIQGEDNERQNYSFEPRTTDRIEIEILEWNERGRKDVIGIDNIWLNVERPPDFDERVQPLVGIGGLVAYPRGAGGFVLNQIKPLEHEAVPANREKKRHIVASVLQNLNATFTTSRISVPGLNLAYTPITLKDHAQLFLRSSEGWPVKGNDLSALPIGKQRFAHVDYEIFDFLTSPLPSAVTLANDAAGWDAVAASAEVTGIPVGRQADALFFLHTLVQHQGPRPGRKGNQEPPKIFEYRITYADGSKVDIPVQLQRQIGDWLPRNPESLPEAALAWSGPAGGGKRAAIYQLRWQNPHPDKAIASIGLRYVDDGAEYGSPVVLAITAAGEE